MKNKLYTIIKRILDICFALIGLIFLVLISVVIIPVIKLETKGNAIFKQKRVGRNGKIIEIYKFRSMINNADKLIQQLPDNLKNEYQENYKIQADPRITKVGAFLRNTNLDELPQVINVLKGEMSIIGPRPIIEEEIRKYNKSDLQRLLSIRPGLSGYWQVNRNNCKNYHDRIKMELYYVENQSLILDLKILLQTFKVIAKMT